MHQASRLVVMLDFSLRFQIMHESIMQIWDIISSRYYPFPLYQKLTISRLQVDLYNKFVTPSLPCKIAEQHARDFAQNPESLAIAQQSPPTTINPLSRRRQISQSSEVDGNTTQEIGVRSFTSIVRDISTFPSLALTFLPRECAEILPILRIRILCSQQ